MISFAAAPSLTETEPVPAVTVPRLLELSCVGQGRPLPDITWSRNDMILTSNLARISMNDSNNSVSLLFLPCHTDISEVRNGDTITSTLSILPSINTDHGAYLCTAANIHGNQTNSISVNVQCKT